MELVPLAETLALSRRLLMCVTVLLLERLHRFFTSRELLWMSLCFSSTSDYHRTILPVLHKMFSFHLTQAKCVYQPMVFSYVVNCLFISFAQLPVTKFLSWICIKSSYTKDRKNCFSCDMFSVFLKILFVIFLFL